MRQWFSFHCPWLLGDISLPHPHFKNDGYQMAKMWHLHPCLTFLLISKLLDKQNNVLFFIVTYFFCPFLQIGMACFQCMQMISVNVRLSNWLQNTNFWVKYYFVTKWTLLTCLALCTSTCYHDDHRWREQAQNTPLWICYCPANDDKQCSFIVWLYDMIVIGL